MTRLPPDLEAERYELQAAAPYRFALARRQFLGVVGGGLAVAVTASARAQESGRGRPASDAAEALTAWLHIARDGAVTVFTGKVEVGQNIRTSLTQAVCDELRVEPAAVSLVMGDTRLTPYDAGTFGSRTTPFMAPRLAAAAATARDLLIGRAARRLELDRAVLSVRSGRIEGPDGRSVGYGELVGDEPLAGDVPASPPVAGRAEWRSRGRSEPKLNAVEIVTGRHRYPSDVSRPDLWHGRVLRPPSAGAALQNLEADALRGLDGVSLVRDGDFVGVVASRSRLAAAALDALEARWHARPDLPSSDSVYEHLVRTARAGGRRGPHVAGDSQRALQAASKVWEAAYHIPYIAHVPLEPRAAVAEWTGEGLTVWTGTQRPFGVREQLAEAFRLPESRVRVIVPDTGSAYGGKHSGEHAVEAARLAKAAGRPVRLVWSREEEFAHGYFRPAGVIAVKAGVDDVGRLVAWEFDNWNSGGSAIQTPYTVPHQRVAFHASDSPLRQGSYRGLAATANHFAREMHMDAIGRALNVDAVEFRLSHLEDARMRAVLTAAAERIGWPGDGGGDRSLGIACGTEKGSYVATAARLARASDGFRVERLVVSFECGAIVNPDGLRHQVEGAVVQGLGGALFEAVTFENGRVTNARLRDYRVPRFRDVPPIDVVLLDRPDLPSVGAGETPIVCVAPAIGSAARAFGEVATALPIAYRSASA